MLATAASPASSSHILWYLTRGTGVVALVLLTITVALGIANQMRLQSARVPRFVIDSVHRSASLLAVSFVLVHIATTVLDNYVSISLINAVLPFSGTYKPFWLGLGAISFDLLIAVALTSMLRRHIGHRAWRATHWLAYLSWPVALVHGIGIGSDRHAHWMLALTAACVLIVLAAVVARISQGSSPPAPQPRPGRPRTRVSALTGPAAGR